MDKGKVMRKMKALYKVAFVIACIALVLGCVSPDITMPVTGAVISIPDAIVSPGEQVTLTINITNIAKVGAITIFLDYDPAIVSVYDIENIPKDMPGWMGPLAAFSFNNSEGIAKMTWFCAEGKTGDFRFANIILKAGDRKGISPLNLTVVTLKDVIDQSIACSIDNGTLTVGLLEGDVNLDKHVSIVDAMFIAQEVIGLKSLNASELECADTFDTGNPNIADAMHIAQWVVDPNGNSGVLKVPLWQSPGDDYMLLPEE